MHVFVDFARGSVRGVAPVSEGFVKKIGYVAAF